MMMFSQFNPIPIPQIHSMMIMIPPIMMIPMMMKKSPNLWMITMKKMMFTLYNQFSMNKSSLSYSMSMMIMIFSMVLYNNIEGLIPESFSNTALMSTNFPLALSLWMSCLLFKMIKSPKKFMMNLVPLGTPMMLTPIMILIEIISMLIQPITLSIRLTTNITAGHTLMFLITELYKITNPIMFHMMLVVLELSVCLIQAYVFSLLLSMYMK